MIENAAQHTIDWYRARMGNITGSNVGLLMKKGRSDVFSDTAMSYIYQVASERAMNPAILEDDYLFSEYLKLVDTTSKSMRWGNEQEVNARDLYSKISGRRIVEVGSCKHPTIPHFASSPDGFYYNENTEVKSCLEIKCPNMATFMRYRSEIYDNESLKTVKYEYFYQCMSHMMCTNSQETYFIAYNPFQTDPIHIVRILSDEKVFAEMEKRIRLANDIISQIINK